MFQESSVSSFMFAVGKQRESSSSAFSEFLQIENLLFLIETSLDTNIDILQVIFYRSAIQEEPKTL